MLSSYDTFKIYSLSPIVLISHVFQVFTSKWNANKAENNIEKYKISLILIK